MSICTGIRRPSEGCQILRNVRAGSVDHFPAGRRPQAIRASDFIGRRAFACDRSRTSPDLVHNGAEDISRPESENEQLWA
jgi:hypothetical protein